MDHRRSRRRNFSPERAGQGFEIHRASSPPKQLNLPWLKLWRSIFFWGNVIDERPIEQQVVDDLQPSGQVERHVHELWLRQQKARKHWGERGSRGACHTGYACGG